MKRPDSIAIIASVFGSIANAQSSFDSPTKNWPPEVSAACEYFMYESFLEDMPDFIIFDGGPTSATIGLNRYLKITWLNANLRTAGPADALPIFKTEGPTFSASIICLADVVDHRILEISIQPGPFVGETVDAPDGVKKEVYSKPPTKTYAVGNMIHQGKY